jgi:hypothetical protein
MSDKISCRKLATPPEFIREDQDMLPKEDRYKVP